MNPRGTVAMTGATGFLGRALVSNLLAAGEAVVALARPSTDRSRLQEHDGLTWIEYDDLGAPSVERQLSACAPTAFVHLSWAGVGGSSRGATDQVAVNVAPTVTSVRLAAACGCSYWLGVGSQAEYGPAEELLEEDAPLRPTTEYGVAKVAAAAAAHAVGEAIDITTGWARVFSVYGPGDHATAILPYVISELLAGRSPEVGACTQDWDLLYVDDAAAGIAALVRAELPGPTNVASGFKRPLRDAIDLSTSAVGGLSAPHFGDAPGPPLRSSVERLRSVGWQPEVVLEEGVPRTVEHMRQSPPAPIGARK